MGFVTIARDAAVIGVREVEGAAFEQLYATTWRDVYRYAWALVRNRDDAEDVAGETYRRAFEAWREGRGPQENEIAWLFLIARRIVIDRDRRKRLISWLPLPAGEDASDPRGDEAFRRSEVWLWFERLCEALPPKQREALLLRYQFDLSDEATAKVMDVSVANVRTLVSRALATIRQRPEVLEA